MVIDPPYLIFLGDVPDALAAKTDWGSSTGDRNGASASCVSTDARRTQTFPIFRLKRPWRKV
jgi:hypothetical protein